MSVPRKLISYVRHPVSVKYEKDINTLNRGIGNCLSLWVASH